MQRPLLLLLPLFLCSFQIARDPSWLRIDLFGKTEYVNAYINALVMEMSETEKTPLHLVDVNWDTLLRNLGQEYSGALSGMEQDLETREKYSFSHPVLKLGPVLVVRKGSGIRSLKGLKNKIIGISPYGRAVLLAQKVPGGVIHEFASMPQALEALSQGQLDGVLIPSLQAEALVPHRYGGRLQIVTKPLTGEGIYLATIKGQEPKLQKIFNQGLRRMEKSGRSKVLLRKFEVQ